MLSAFTLMDLPDAQTRMEKLQALWQKCDGYLVLIENGTKDGFRLINEAREFILQQIRESEQDGGTGYLFAPVWFFKKNYLLFYVARINRLFFRCALLAFSYIQ